MIAAREVAASACVRLVAWPAPDLSALVDANDAVVCCARVSSGRAAVNAMVREILGSVLLIDHRVSPSVPGTFGSLRQNVRPDVHQVRHGHPDVPARVTTTILSETDLARAPGGKPYLTAHARGLPLNFNISHSGDVLLVALSRSAEVGVDVERVRAVPEWRTIAGRMFDAVARNRLLAEVACGADEGDAFIREWCRLEAAVKATGIGIFAGAPDASAAPLHSSTTASAPTRILDLPDLPLPAGAAHYRGALALCP